jgi:quercetin dioxygenase-like cupin family protein
VRTTNDRHGRTLWLALACASVLALTPQSGGATDATVQQLITERLGDVPGRELDMLTVEYPPGGWSGPHRHNAYVLVYVLEGTVEMQVDGRETVTIPTGGTFIERPEDVHTVSRNPSRTVPAKFLVIALKKVGQPLSESAGPQTK